MSDFSRDRRPVILAIANQKGGVGKTTTVINLAACLVEAGASVLLVDLDPQGNASTGLGIAPESRKATSYDLLIDERPLREVTLPSSIAGLDIVPANSDLSSADIDLVANEKRSFLLHDALRHGEALQPGHDFILIDCPPSLSLLTVNALVAADSVLVPLQAEFFALEGLSHLMMTIRKVRAAANPGLRIEGVLMTMSDARNRLSQLVEADARQNLGDLVFRTVIPRNVRLSEAPSFAQPILQYDPQSKGSEAYRSLAVEILQRHPLRKHRDAVS